MAISRFEGLVAWQKARLLTSAIYKLTIASDSFARDFSLKDQIRRAAVSVMSNVAEGFERSSAKEFHHFLVIAKASCAELRAQLYVALDAGYINEQQFQNTMNQAEEVSRIIGGLRSSLKSRMTTP